MVGSFVSIVAAISKKETASQEISPDKEIEVFMDEEDPKRHVERHDLVFESSALHVKRLSWKYA